MTGAQDAAAGAPCASVVGPPRAGRPLRTAVQRGARPRASRSATRARSEAPPRRSVWVRSAFGARSAAENQPLSDRVLSRFKGLHRRFGKKFRAAETVAMNATRARQKSACPCANLVHELISDRQNYSDMTGRCIEILRGPVRRPRGAGGLTREKIAPATASNPRHRLAVATVSRRAPNGRTCALRAVVGGLANASYPPLSSRPRSLLCGRMAAGHEVAPLRPRCAGWREPGGRVAGG